MLKHLFKKKKKLKTMNSKMMTSSQLSTTESENTKTNYANNWNRNRIIEMEITW